MAAVTVRSIRDLMVVVLVVLMVVVHDGPCRDAASLLPPVVFFHEGLQNIQTNEVKISFKYLAMFTLNE